MVGSMMDRETKAKVRARLRRIAGQVEAIERMIDEDRYCVDVMNQVAAVQAALGKVGGLVLRPHVEHCVADAMRSGDVKERKRKTEELVALFGRFGL